MIHQALGRNGPQFARSPKRQQRDSSIGLSAPQHSGQCYYGVRANTGNTGCALLDRT